MTIGPLVDRAQRLLVGIVLVMSGAYQLIYLYRWEWNRAIVSGLFFLAAEVALASSMLLRRMQRLERAASSPPTALERLRQTPIERPNPFAWLDPRSGRVGVFVPVLLGAGAILSALAYVVERVAESTAVPLVDRRLANRLAVLAPPSRHAVTPAPARSALRRTPAATVLAVAAVAITAWLAHTALLDATQSRPDPTQRPDRTAIELAVSHRSGPEHYFEGAEALWGGCRSTLGSLPIDGRVADLGSGHVMLVLEPGIGELRTRRLLGCLTDLRVSSVLARVVDVETTP